ncbi:hypothetical protein H4687_008931 [Streptomyces stelliscabiei]|uniref:Uncharacterized protein n=2 Tax=Streptomyces stelliscabiei TaxID=146820 RepID=A0A8I0PEQ1_9ACTN|nr:hypothetical protein [Streptomyces stelliscabiei]
MVGVVAGVLFGPVLQVLQCGGDAAGEVGQGVLHRRWMAGVHGTGDQPTGFEVAVTDVAVTRAVNTVTVLGGPTALIHLADWTLLTDPPSDAAGTEYRDGPVLVRKTADPALKPAQLPALDAVVVVGLTPRATGQ